MKSPLTNVLIFGGYVLRAFCKFFYLWSFVSSDHWMKENCVANIILDIWVTFLDKNNCNSNSYKLTHKFAFIAFLSFCLNQKQESIFQEVGGLVTKIFLFFLLRVNRALLQSHAEFNSLIYRDFLTCCSCSFIVSFLNKDVHSLTF